MDGGLTGRVEQGYEKSVSVGPQGRVTLKGCASFGGDEKRRGRAGASGGSKRNFSFDHAVDEGTSQEDVFELVGKPLADALHRGVHGCLLAYGQTGAGKTFTMQGPEGLEGSRRGEEEKQSQRGLIQRTFERVFNLVERSATVGSASGTKVESNCSCNYLQIYNEQVQDLLNPSSESTVLIREDRDGLVHVEGAKAEVLTSAQQAYKMFQRGNKNRKVGSTALNSESSRSHAVFVIHLETTLTSGTKGSDDFQVARRFSSLYLVDLAGSERQRQSQTKGQSLKEAGNINKSLSQLGQTIKSLAENAESGGKGGGAFVPYRNSKLTFLLKNALVGRSMCSLIANVSPAQDNVDETLSTLVFASRAKLVTNSAGVNEDVTYSEAALHAELKKLREENERLKKQHGTAAPAKVNGESIAAVSSSGTTAGAPAGMSEAATKRLQRLQDLLVSERASAQKRLEDALFQPEASRAQVDGLQERTSRLEKELHSTMLRLRMKEEKIARLQDVPEMSEYWSNEIRDVAKENEILRKQLECPADVIRYKMELAEAERQLQKRGATDVSELREKCETLVSELSQTIAEKQSLNKTASDSQKSLRKLERAFVEQSAIQEEMFSKLKNGDAKKELGKVMEMKATIAGLRSHLDQVLLESQEELRELKSESDAQCVESVVLGITTHVASEADFAGLREERDALQAELTALAQRVEADSKVLEQKLASSAKEAEEALGVERQKFSEDLERQVQKAGSLEKELSQSKAALSTNEEAVKELVAEVAAVKAEADKLRAEIQGKDAEIASIHEEHVHLEQHALGHSNLLTEKMAENISLQGQLESCIAERDAERVSRTKLSQSNENLETENSRLQAEMKSLHEQKGVGQAETSRLQAELNSARERAAISESEFSDSTAAMQKELEAKRELTSQLQADLDKEREALASAGATAEALQERLDSANAEVSKNATAVEDLRKANSALEFQNTENEIRIQDMTESLQASSLERESLQEEVSALGGKLSRTTAAESKKNAEVTERARLLQSEVANLMADHATKEKVVRQLEEKVVTLEAQTAELSGVREALAQAEKSVFELTESKLQLESDIKENEQLRKETQQLAVYKKEIAYLESAHDETRKHLKVLKHQAHKDKEASEKKLVDAEARVEQLTMLKDFSEARAEELQSKVIALEMVNQSGAHASTVERENKRRQSAVMEQVKAEQQVAELREELTASREDKKQLQQELNSLKQRVDLPGDENTAAPKSVGKTRMPFGEISQNATPAKTPTAQKPLKAQQDTATRRMTRSMRRSIGSD